jgi:hypothetical protein
MISVINPSTTPGLKPGVCSGLILSGAFYPVLKGGVSAVEVSIFTHHMGNCLLKSIEGQFKHRKDLLDVTDGTGVGPFLGQFWIDPDRMGEGVGDKLEPHITWLS